MAPVKKKDDMKDLFQELTSSYNAITEHPEKFLLPQPYLCPKIRDFVHKTYKAAVECDTDNKNTLEILPELVVDEDLDEEQIWQQLEVRNSIVMDQLIKQTAELLSLREQEFEIHLDESDAEDELGGEDEEEDDLSNDGDEKFDETNGVDEDADLWEDDNEDEPKKKPSRGKEKQKQRKGRKTIVDDKFFKLSEMEEFLEQEDNKELRKQNGKPSLDEGEIDYFADDMDDGEDSDGDNLNYKDFFDDDIDDGEGSEGDNPNFKDYFAEDDDDLKKKKTKKPEKDSSDGEENDDPNFKDFFAEDDNGAELENKTTKKSNKPKKVSFANGHSDDEEEEEEIGESNDDDGASDDSDEDNNKEVSKTDRLQPASDSESDDDGDDNENDNEDEYNEEQEELTEEQKSNFEMRERRLQQRMRDYEAEVLGEKPWQLRGEVGAPNRPQNSLLEEILEFDSNIRPAPVITEETTRCLEDIIRQRIKDQAWDDPVRTVRPNITPQEFRKQLILDQEKPKESLAKVYENEYQRELDKHSANRDETNEPVPKAHQEIRNAMHMLFRKLDALSNFHFIPKPVAPEPKIVTNTPAINMEEVAPVALSDAALLAPEEIFRGPKHELVGKAERTRTDKNRERRKKKQKQRAINSALEKRDLKRQKEGKPISKKTEDAKLLKSITKQRNVKKITASQDQGSLKSTKSFFSKLQETTNGNGIAGKKRSKTQSEATDSSKFNAKKLKL